MFRAIVALATLIQSSQMKGVVLFDSFTNSLESMAGGCTCSKHAICFLLLLLITVAFKSTTDYDYTNARGGIDN